MNLEKIVREKQGTIVDVRSTEEFSDGHVDGSINIPLHELEQNIAEIKSLKQPLLLCCASGARSGRALQYLSQMGIECYNGGSYLEVQNYLTQTL